MANKPFQRRNKTQQQLQVPTSTVSMADSKLQADTSTMSLGTPNISMSNASKISASMKEEVKRSRANTTVQEKAL